MRQHLLALVVVQHSGNCAAFDRGQHREHRFRRVAQHDADHITAADSALGEHRRVTIGGLVRLGVGDLLIAEPNEDPVTGTGGTVSEDLADRGLGTRLSQQSGQRGPHDHRSVH